MHPADVGLCAWESFSLDCLAAPTERACFDPWLKTASSTFIMLLFQALSRVLARFMHPPPSSPLFCFSQSPAKIPHCHEGLFHLLSPLRNNSVGMGLDEHCSLMISPLLYLVTQIQHKNRDHQENLLSTRAFQVSVFASSKDFQLLCLICLITPVVHL